MTPQELHDLRRIMVHAIQEAAGDTRGTPLTQDLFLACSFAIQAKHLHLSEDFLRALNQIDLLFNRIEELTPLENTPSPVQRTGPSSWSTPQGVLRRLEPEETPSNLLPGVTWELQGPALPTLCTVETTTGRHHLLVHTRGDAWIGALRAWRAVCRLEGLNMGEEHTLYMEGPQPPKKGAVYDPA